MQEYKYKIGGSLSLDDPSYVERQADQDLYERLRAGEFCYVLNSRQMGKSSLRVRTMCRLERDNIACAVIDVADIGTQQVPLWYNGFIGRIVRKLNLPINAGNWLREHEYLPAVNRLSVFIETILLVEIHQLIVIFIDEIDGMLNLDFKDDFFAFIRACYNERTENSQYNRLTFALLGVASPSDLIQDKQRTPFNIGRAIQLNGFRSHEAQPLAQGFVGHVSDPQAVLEQVLAWTGGQPFLTQKLCGWIAQELEDKGQKPELTSQAPNSQTQNLTKAQLVRLSILDRFYYDVEIQDPVEAEWVKRLMRFRILDRFHDIWLKRRLALVARLIRERIVENWEAQDEPEHLRTIRNRLLQNEKQAGRLLGLYQEISRQGEVSADDSSDQILLRLTGLVVQQEGKLRVYNPIYALVFNQDWVNQELANLRPYAEAIAAWKESGCTDQSRLLRGKALEDALAWSTGKSLSAEDNQFLTASQSYENWEVKQANQVLQETQQKTKQVLVKQQEANQILQETQQKKNQALAAEQVANRRLKRTQRKTRRVLLIGAAGLIGMVILAVVIVTTSQAKLQDVRTAIDWERRGVEAQKQFETDQLGALIAAMQVGREMEAKIYADRSPYAYPPVTDYPAYSPLLALQTILSNILEHNRLTYSSGLTVPPALREVGFSPDGKQIFADTSDTDAGDMILLWNESGQLLRKHKVPAKSAVRSTIFTPAGARIVTFDNRDRKVKLWNLSGKSIAAFSPNQDVSKIISSPNGKQIATFDHNNMMKLWNLSGQQFMETEASAINFDSSDKWIVTGGKDGIVKLWNSSGQLLTAFEINPTYKEREILRISLSGVYGGEIATYTTGGSIQFWNLKGQQVNGFFAYKVDSLIMDVSFSPDHERIATFYEDGTMLLCNRSGLPLAKFKAPQRYQTRGVFSSGRLVIPANSYTSGDDLVLWDLPWDQIRQPIGFKIGKDDPWQVRVSSDDKQFVVQVSRENSAPIVQIWKDLGHQGEQKLSEFVGKITEDEKIIAAMKPGTVQLLDLSGQQLAEFRHQGKPLYPWNVHFSPDGKQVTTIASSGIDLWNLAGKHLAHLKIEERKSLLRIQAGITIGVRFSPDSNQIAITERSSVRLWNQSGKQLAKLEQERVNDVRFSPDSKRIATVADDGSAFLWNASGQKLAELKENQEYVGRLGTGQKLAKGEQERVS